VIAVVPANEAGWEDLRPIFGTRGASAGCFCQRYKLARGEAFRKFPPEERARRLRDQACGAETSGLVAYADGDPAGWCAVEPRPHYVGLVRVARVPWQGRDEDRADPSVWAVTCLLTRKGFRGRGVSRALAAAAVDHARSRGARALEAYPMTTTDALLEELHPGLYDVFAAAGFTEVARPSVRRAVMRVDFS
jgi:GNAT superfamily N-acetyltransferase